MSVENKMEKAIAKGVEKGILKSVEKLMEEAQENFSLEKTLTIVTAAFTLGITEGVKLGIESAVGNLIEQEALRAIQFLQNNLIYLLKHKFGEILKGELLNEIGKIRRQEEFAIVNLIILEAKTLEEFHKLLQDYNNRV